MVNIARPHPGVLRASFSYERLPGSPGVVAIRDLDDGMSVTNDAEAVIVYLAGSPFLLKDGERVIYEDTMGRWDELAHRDGRFVGFLPIGARSLEVALMVVDTPTEDHSAGPPIVVRGPLERGGY